MVRSALLGLAALLASSCQLKIERECLPTNSSSGSTSVPTAEHLEEAVARFRNLEAELLAEGFDLLSEESTPQGRKATLAGRYRELGSVEVVLWTARSFDAVDRSTPGGGPGDGSTRGSIWDLSASHVGGTLSTCGEDSRKGWRGLDQRLKDAMKGD